MTKENQLSYKQIRKIINELNSLNLADTDYAYIKNLVLRLKIGRQFEGGIINQRHRFYRGIIYDDKPVHIKFMSYPPAHLVTNFQRANPPGRPMFYSCVNPGIPFFELNISPGKKVYLSKWSTSQEFGIITVNGIKNDDKLDKLVKTYFQTKLSQKIHGALSSDYKITCAMAESLSIGMITNPLNGQNYDMGGIAYPSVRMSSHQENVAIRPEIVDSCLKLDYVEEYLINKINGDNIEWKKLDFANEFPNGHIEWKGRPSYYAIAKNTGDEFKMTMELFGWVVRDKNGNILDPV